MVVALAPVVEHLAPALVFLHSPELPGIVVVHFNHQPSFGRILRKVVLHEVASVVDVGRRSLDDEHASRVVASCGSHGVDEHLLVLNEVVRGILVVGVGLVQSGEEQSLVVVAEGRGNLCPKCMQNGFVLVDGVDVRVGDMVLQPSSVPVVVNDDVEVGVQAVVHDFLHACHPLRINGVVGAVGEMAHDPGAGNAHGLEPAGFHVVDDLLRGLGLLPRRLGAQSAFVGEVVRVVAGLHGVTEVPTGCHLFNHLADGSVEVCLCLCCCECYGQ